MVLSRYRDVAAALRDPLCSIAGGAVDENAHRKMREQAHRLYSSARIAAWQPEFASMARRIAESLNVDDEEAELIQDLAEPWSLDVAALVTGLDAAEARRLAPAARIIFDAGASPDLRLESTEATLALAARFPSAAAALHVQAFVALAVSMPAFLGNAWLALLQNPNQFDWISERNAIDELLRFAGPSIKQIRLRESERIELRLAEANRDPDQFPDPGRLDLRRDAAGHLAFGAGPHACAGALLVKAATASILPVFAEHFRQARLLRAEPYGGDAIRGHRVYVTRKPLSL